MSYEKVDPVSIETIENDGIIEPAEIWLMKKKRYMGHHTVCETLREIYKMTDNEEIKYKCRVAMAMTKKMHEKLKEYAQKENLI